MNAPMIMLLVAIVTRMLTDTFSEILPGVPVDIVALNTDTYQVTIMGETIAVEVITRGGNCIEFIYRYYELETSHLTAGALVHAILRHISK